MATSPVGKASVSGNRQHYLPRMLLRRFANMKGQVRVAPKEGHPYLVSINNIGLENNFNGPPGKDSADDRVTREENEVSQMLGKVCELSGVIDSALGAAVLAHFSARTKALREIMLEMSKKVVSDLQEEFSDAHKSGEEMVNWIRANPSEITDILDSEVKKSKGAVGLAAYRASALRQRHFEAALDQVIAMAQSPAGSAELHGRANQFFNYLEERLHDSVRDAHIKAALTAPTPPKWRERLQALTFEVRCYPEGLILGDAVGWCGHSSEDGFPIMRFDDDIPFAAMPLNGTRALVGVRSGVREFSRTEINHASARASADFLLGHPEVSDLGSYVGLVGTGSQRAWIGK